MPSKCHKCDVVYVLSNPLSNLTKSAVLCTKTTTPWWLTLCALSANSSFYFRSISFVSWQCFRLSMSRSFSERPVSFQFYSSDWCIRSVSKKIEKAVVLFDHVARVRRCMLVSQLFSWCRWFVLALSLLGTMNVILLCQASRNNVFLVRRMHFIMCILHYRQHLSFALNSLDFVDLPLPLENYRNEI